MATRIVELSIDAPPRELVGLEGYDRVLFLVRLKGIPIGQMSMAVRRDSVEGRELRTALREQFSHLVATQIVRDELVSNKLNRVPSRPSATVVVCTRERPNDLVRCLSSLANLVNIGQETLVVDNCPATDATRKVVESHPNVRYVCEPRRGLDNARNCAVREAKGEVLAFIDDDAVADPRWLVNLIGPFSDDRVQCVTGLIMPLELETEAQEVFETLSGFSKRGFSRRVFQSPPISPLATGGIGAGANMAIRRSVVAEIGPFDEALDAGTASQSGGDHEFFTRVLRAGHQIVYEPEALNWHRHRRSWEELRNVIHGYGVGVYAAWTRSFLYEREWGVFRRAVGWFVHDQAPRLVRSLLRPSRNLPFDVLWAELRGCWIGPFAYLKARRIARRLTDD